MDPVAGEPDHLMNLAHLASVYRCGYMEPIVPRPFRQLDLGEKF